MGSKTWKYTDPARWSSLSKLRRDATKFGQRALMVLHITMTEMALHGSRVSLLQHLIKMRLQQRLDDELIIGIRCVGAGRLWNMQDRGA